MLRVRPIDVSLTVSQPLDVEDFFMAIESDNQRMIEVVGQLKRHMAVVIRLTSSNTRYLFLCASDGFSLVIKDQ